MLIHEPRGGEVDQLPHAIFRCFCKCAEYKNVQDHVQVQVHVGSGLINSQVRLATRASMLYIYAHGLWPLFELGGNRSQALTQNVKRFKNHLVPMSAGCVVKANAYGHGLLETSRVMLMPARRGWQ